MYFTKEQEDFKADFGFSAPYKTKSKCSKPIFSDPNLHRIAIMKDEHFGSKGDRDENGVPGWRSKQICTSCGKEFNKKRKAFYLDKH